jgi:hypothetical protein
MTRPKYAPRRDISEPEIVSALLKAGYHVWRELPVDLLVWRPDTGFRLLENKTPTKTGKRRKRVDQQKQDEFVRLTGTPVVMTPEEALRALGAKLA